MDGGRERQSTTIKSLMRTKYEKGKVKSMEKERREEKKRGEWMKKRERAIGNKILRILLHHREKP